LPSAEWFAHERTLKLDGEQCTPILPPSEREGDNMRRIADYTIGVVIVLVHLIVMGRQNERISWQT